MVLVVAKSRASAADDEFVSIWKCTEACIAKAAHDVCHPNNLLFGILLSLVFRFAAMALAEELKSEIDEVFRMFDEDDSGSIDAGELASALYTITGEHIPREEALQVMQKYDQDHNGGIDRNEFEQMVLERMKGRSFQEETTRAFKLLEDKDMPGFVTKESVRAVAAEAGEKLSEAELAEMFDVIVTGQQAAAVDFPTFCSIQYAAENAEERPV